MALKTGDIAERLGIHENTIRGWSRSYGAFLSTDATGKAPSAKRKYSERDALVLATIADLRDKGLTHEQVIAALEAGQRVEVLPTAQTPAEAEAREQVALVPLDSLQRALDQVRTLQNEIDRVIAERDKAMIDREEANRQIADLREELGSLKGELRAIDAERLPTRVTLTIILAAMLGVLAIIAVVVIVLLRAG